MFQINLFSIVMAAPTTRGQEKLQSQPEVQLRRGPIPTAGRRVDAVRRPSRTAGE